MGPKNARKRARDVNKKKKTTQSIYFMLTS